MVWRRWAAVFLAISIVLAPVLVEARAGGSYRIGGGSSFSSLGSRGSQTYSYNGAAPIQRSVTPQTGSGSGYGTQPGYGGYGYGHPFLTGMFGGFFGSWLGGMLFPHWGMGYGGPSMMGPGMMGPNAIGGGPYGGGYSGIGPMSSFPAFGTPRVVTQSDYQEFETILTGVQKAWSNGDLGAMRHLTTPEMLSYFSEQLAENESQGVANKVENVELIKGEVREAWDEGRMHYATALMHWRALDYTVKSGGNPSTGELIVGGDAQHPSEASEMWTFAGSPGGRWLLSAIQQV